jgi:polyphenol oxidase
VLEPLEKDGVVLLTAPGLLRSGVSVVFSGRRGAQGTPPFDGLNLSYSVGDEPAHVRLCRAKLASFAGIEISDTVFCRQVHGTVTRVAGPLERGRGSRDYESALYRCDAIITETKGLSIGVLTADCVPIAIVTRDGGAVAAVHAGWRGLVSGVIENCVRSLSKLSGVAPAEMVAFVGPHIGSCCFEVGEEVAEVFRSRFSPEVASRGGTPHVDMTLSCLIELEREGLQTGDVHFAGDCTCCTDDYFSFRRSGGATGRQGLIVSLLEEEDAGGG